MHIQSSGPVRGGFTLIEVVVAMVLLSTVLVMLAGMTFHTAQRSVDLHSTGSRQALMLQEANRLSALPYADLVAQDGCRTIDDGNGTEYNSCITSTPVGGNTLQVVIIVAPVRASMIRPDTVRFVRAEPPVANPLCSPSC